MRRREEHITNQDKGFRKKDILVIALGVLGVVGFFAVQTIIDMNEARDFEPKLQRLGYTIIVTQSFGPIHGSIIRYSDRNRFIEKLADLQTKTVYRVSGCYFATNPTNTSAIAYYP